MKLVIAFILHLCLGDSNLFINVVFLALSLEINTVEGEVFLVKEIRVVFISVSGLLVVKMVR